MVIIYVFVSCFVSCSVISKVISHCDCKLFQSAVTVYSGVWVLLGCGLPEFSVWGSFMLWVFCFLSCCVCLIVLFVVQCNA